MDSRQLIDTYFRPQGESVVIPSGGRFYSSPILKQDVTGAVRTKAMRGQDELLLKNPDALLSGSALEDILKSCVPDLIDDPNKLWYVDSLALWLAIRINSYGNTTEVEADCPKCKFHNTWDFDLRFMLETIKPLEENYTIRLNDDVVINLQPITMGDQNFLAYMMFEEARRIQEIEARLEDASISHEEKLKQARAARKESIGRIQKLNADTLSRSVASILVPEGEITDRNVIKDIVNEIGGKDFTALDETLNKITEAGVQSEQTMVCSQCNHGWGININIHPTSFFGADS